MKLNSKVTGGLAWAGLVLILAVPSADMLSKPSAWQANASGGADGAAVVEDAAKTAALTAPKPAPRPAVRTASVRADDPVEAFVASGKKLPSYISDTPASETPVQEVAKAPVAPATIKKLEVPATPQLAAVDADGTFVRDTDEITTASVGSVGVTPPPMPYPASLRPEGRSVSTVTIDQPALVIEDGELVRREVASQPVLTREAPPVIAGDELEEWNSGSLADYLERRGLISDSGEPARFSDSEYDEDGFFLSDGPNDDRPRLVGRYRDSWDLF